MKNQLHHSSLKKKRNKEIKPSFDIELKRASMQIYRSYLSVYRSTNLAAALSPYGIE
jgi:hypothetical protein